MSLLYSGRPQTIRRHLIRSAAAIRAPESQTSFGP